MGIPQGPLRDAALIAGAQKAEHYEIASHGTLCALAEQMGNQEAARSGERPAAGSEARH